MRIIFYSPWANRQSLYCLSSPTIQDDPFIISPYATKRAPHTKYIKNEQIRNVLCCRCQLNPIRNRLHCYYEISRHDLDTGNIFFTSVVVVSMHVCRYVVVRNTLVVNEIRKLEMKLYMPQSACFLHIGNCRPSWALFDIRWSEFNHAIRLVDDRVSPVDFHSSNQATNYQKQEKVYSVVDFSSFYNLDRSFSRRCC